METLVIQSKSKAHIKLLFDLAKQLGDKPTIEKNKTKVLNGISKPKFIENKATMSLDRGLKDLKQILNGKRKPKTLDDLLNE